MTVRKAAPSVGVLFDRAKPVEPPTLGARVRTPFDALVKMPPALRLPDFREIPRGHLTQLERDQQDYDPRDWQ